MGVDSMKPEEHKKKTSFSCSLCDSDIPIEPGFEKGDIYYCSYCKISLKIIEKKNGVFSLEAEDEE